MKVTQIYGLYDPRDVGNIVYVGKSDRPDERLYVHARDAHKNLNTRFSRWLLSLKAQGLKPCMRILEADVPYDVWEDREKHWIALYRAHNPNLFNIALGGNGPTIVADETRRRISELKKGSRHTEETKKRMSELAKRHGPERWNYMRGESNPTHRPEVKAKILAANIGRVQSQETRDKIREARMGKCVGDDNPTRRPEVAAKLRKPKSEFTKASMTRSWHIRRFGLSFFDIWESQHLLQGAA